MNVLGKHVLAFPAFLYRFEGGRPAANGSKLSDSVSILDIVDWSSELRGVIKPMEPSYVPGKQYTDECDVIWVISAAYIDFMHSIDWAMVGHCAFRFYIFAFLLLVIL